MSSTRPDARLNWLHRCRSCGAFIRLDASVCAPCEREADLAAAFSRARAEGRVKFDPIKKTWKTVANPTP